MFRYSLAFFFFGGWGGGYGVAVGGYTHQKYSRHSLECKIKLTNLTL